MEILGLMPVGICLLLGMTVAAAADALAPVRRRLPGLCDLVLSLWIVWIWLVIAFRVCRGDLRTGYCVAAAVGAMGWRRWISPAFRPIFVRIWGQISRIFRTILIPAKIMGKKLKNFEKNSFHLEKNRVQ